MKKRFIFLSLLTSCAVGPDYYPPENCITDEWVAPDRCVEPAPVCWWQLFDDELLNSYIELAASHNNDVLKAQSAIFQTRALRQISAAPLYPQLAADFSAYDVLLSKNGPIDIFAADIEAPFPAAKRKVPTHFNLYNNFLDASWELDIFGKTRRSIESAEAEFEKTIAQRDDILISVFAEVARNYIELRYAQEEKRLLEQNVELLQKTLSLTEKRFKTGYTNMLDIEQINIQLNEAIAALPTVNTNIYKSIFALSVLIGESPETLLDELILEKPLPKLPETLCVGLRSDLLRHRPDIREAERHLAKSSANIGVAYASFFPTVSLTALLGLDSLKLTNLYTPRSLTSLAGGDINLPLFQGGRLVGNLKVAEAENCAAAFAYQQTILKALQETETAIISYENNKNAVSDFQKIVDSNTTLVSLSKKRYSKGLTNQLDFITQELTLNNAELSLLQSESAALLDLISLYKALGGGWQPFCN